LTQALGAGFLSGQEFNSVAEQAPAVLQAIAKEVDRPIGQLKQLAKDGKLTSEVLLRALKRVETEGADRLAEALDTPAQKVKNLQNNVEDLNIELGKLVLPAVEDGLEGVSGAAEKATEEVIKTQKAAKTLAEIMDRLDGLFTSIDANPVIKWLGDIGKAAANSALLLIPFASQIKTLVKLRDILAGQRPKFEDDGFIGPQVPENLKPLKDRLGLGDPDDPTGKGKADKAAERAAREEERLQQRLAALRVELNLIEDNANFKTQITAAEIAGNKELAIRLKAQQTINTIQANEEKALIRIEDIREINLVKQETAAKINAANVDAAAALAVFEDQKQKAFDEQIESLNFQYEILTATTVEEQKRLEIAQQMAALEDKDFTPDQLDQIKAAKEKLDIGPIETYVNELQRSLSDTESMVVSLAQSVESSLATAMSSAVQTLITGTGSVKEAFSDMFAGIGKAFIDMATQMIAKALIMKAIGILTSAFGGGGGGGGSMAGMFDLSGGQFGAFAEGGYVTGPTNAVIGEGGEPEYVIPESKMRESMGRYSRGSRGSSVIPAEGGGAAGTEGGTAVAAPIDVRYTVERINSVDYVTADQFQNGMKRAALEGAQRGQQLTLSRLQQSPSTRRRIGM
jgi:tape measure domain-containing protein